MSEKRPHPTTGEEKGKKMKPEEEKKQQDKAMASSRDPPVFCDICGERKQKAVKTCLTCQSSYCDSHLKPHHSVARLKKHRLINAVEKREFYICQKHERPLELFCRDDQTCVCLSCTEGEHSAHKTVPIKLESRKKKADVRRLIDKRKKKIKEIQDSVDLKKKDTEERESSNAKIFTDLIRSIEKCRSDRKKMIKEKQKAAEKQAEDLIKELNQEISELNQEITELEQLSRTDDHLHVIQLCLSPDSRPQIKNWTQVRIDSDVRSLDRGLAELKKTQERLLKQLSPPGLKPGWMMDDGF